MCYIVCLGIPSHLEVTRIFPRVLIQAKFVVNLILKSRRVLVLSPLRPSLALATPVVVRQ